MAKRSENGTGLYSPSMYLHNTGASIGLLPGRKNVGPLMLMVACPILSLYLWWLIVNPMREERKSLKGGGIMSFDEFKLFQSCFPSFFDRSAWTIVLTFAATALILTKLIPCKTFLGPESPTGYKNRYHDNGLTYWLSVNVLYFVGGSLKLYSFGILYDNYGSVLASLNLFAIVFCSLLYIKGMYYPSSKDCGASGSFIFDFYYGSELYPNVFGWDLKQFSNDRFGMAWWGIACLSFAGKQYEQIGYISDSMIISVALQWIYLTKFFYWETGYFCSLDIQHDRAGFYICWGCLVWVPAVYTSSSMWLVANPMNIGFAPTALMLIAGIAMIWTNYNADAQRSRFRASNGACMIWGKKPKFITAEYYDQQGNKKPSLLLLSGWWGVSRHFHYLPEILAAFFWSPPIQTYSLFPYIYTIFLAILLVDRAFRDDARCFSKYGSYWEEYRRAVPYMLIPRLL